ncbi:MAG: M56 family metallopeptidase [Lachnospiraceae bacterium]|jgi:beta-lactamase regulating signal transducer with metallopeptidase domain|nr:M56 family metallopeptidase [Lachnospiraceae bacterium]
MVWIRLWISCIAFLSVAGSISYGLTRLAGGIWRVENPVLLLALQKLTLILYWLPVSFAFVCISRISYENGVKAYTGEFVCSSVSSMTAVFYLLGMIWLGGFLLSAARTGIKMRRLAGWMKGNVPVRDVRYLDLFEVCRRQAGIDHVLLSQNDLLNSPITVGLVRKQMILPFADYTDIELHMIYEHELMHIKKGDLSWRIFALVTSWIHWFNPVIYPLMREMDCLQEMICDLSISIDNAHYTKKEYAAFLVRLTDQNAGNVYTTALTENKSQTIRRIEIMAKTKSFSKPKRWRAGISCVCLAVMSMIPTTAVSAEAARLQEDWMRAEEISVEIQPLDDFVVQYGYDDGSVIEINRGLEYVPYSSKVELDMTINANTRCVYQYRSMSAGNSISISTVCDDTSATYKIGIKNKETGKMEWISGTGKLVYDFDIVESGSYAAFVENNNNFPIKIEGTAMY